MLEADAAYAVDSCDRRVKGTAENFASKEKYITERERELKQSKMNSSENTFSEVQEYMKQKQEHAVKGYINTKGDTANQRCRAGT